MSQFNYLMHNVSKWSDTLADTLDTFAAKFLKVCLTILGHYALKD